jgi:hypothetical protein
MGGYHICRCLGSFIEEWESLSSVVEDALVQAT